MTRFVRAAALCCYVGRTAITVRSDQQAPKGWLLVANEQECALTALTFLLQASEKQAMHRLQLAMKARICDQNLVIPCCVVP